MRNGERTTAAGWSSRCHGTTFACAVLWVTFASALRAAAQDRAGAAPLPNEPASDDNRTADPRLDDEHAPEHERPPHTGEELGVTATVPARAVEDPPAAAVSTLAVEPGLLRVVPRRSAEELLTFAPGVWIGNHSGEGHAPTIHLRGFDAGEGQDVEILVDGIPINEPSNSHGHGYADPRFVIPELIGAVQVHQGPFDAQQGDFAIAGSIDYRLGLDRRGILARGEYGSFDTRRLVLAWAPEEADTGTFVGVELRDGSGFGPNRAHFGAAVLGRLEQTIDRGLRIHLLAGVQSAQFDSAGVVRRDDVQAGRLSCADVDPAFCVVDPHQGGSASRYLLAVGVRLERPTDRLSSTVWANLRQLRIRENFTGYLLDPRGDGLDERYETVTAGLRSAYRVRIPWEGRSHHAELGALARHDAGDSSAVRVRRERGVPYATLFDLGLNVTDIGAWIRGELHALEWLTLVAGLRVDAFHYAVIDRDRAALDRDGERLRSDPIDAFGLSLQPRGSASLRVHENVHWITSAGVGTRSSDAAALSEGEEAPFARAIAVETGLALEHAEENSHALTARAGVFHTYVDRELSFDPTRGRNVNAGASNRYGAFVYARLRLRRWLDAAVSFAWTEANLAPDAAYGDLTAGDRLPYVPRAMGRVDLAGHEAFSVGVEPFRIGAGIGITWVALRPLPRAGEADPYAIVDASAFVGWRFVELGLLLRNLFDVRYERATFSYGSRFDLSRPASLAPAEHFAAGAPLMAFVTLTLHLTPLAWLRGTTTTAAGGTP